MGLESIFFKNVLLKYFVFKLHNIFVHIYYFFKRCNSNKNEEEDKKKINS